MTNAVARRAGRPAARLACVAGLALASMAHVGSPDTFFVGDAGPYRITVVTRLPGVIPGRGQVSVRMLDNAVARRVAVQAGQWNVGIDGAPPPEEAAAVPGDPHLFATELWFMTPSSYALFVTVDGTLGKGTAIVPVMALATAQRSLGRGLGLTLAAMGIFLAVGLLTLVGAAVRESVLAPGVAPDRTRRRRSRLAVGVAALLLAVVLFGGRRWWSVEASTYAESILYRPFQSAVDVRGHDGRLGLALEIRDRRWTGDPNPASRYNALTPDHGKLMHLFLIRQASGDVLAHVHPVPRTLEALDFDVDLPPVPPGQYAVFADIVHESGYAQTLVADAHVPSGAFQPSPEADPDDSSFQGRPVPDAAEAVFRFPDGAGVTWSRGAPLRAREERSLTFSAHRADGSPLTIEPYMGMAAHVLVMRDDGSVFVHLHPLGTISMAALQRFTTAWPGAGDPHALHTMPVDSDISIPFAFPRAGHYRLWVQMKSAGRVVTAAFETEIHPEL